ncbi:GntR family transcriptional regulator [Nonomuraea dietziae]|uniref:GntR family transcriptional regulator n=1 Tax=Nonomuraea dietziae TaxID=65515 RepID=UPI0033E33CB6
MTARGLEARQELLRVDTITAAPEIAAQLGLDEDAEVIVRRLMFTVEGEPVQRTDGYYPSSMFAATPVSEALRVRGGVAAYIEDQMGRRISQFVERLSMRMPVPEEIAMLKLGPGVPVVHVQRLARDTEGVPVEFLDSVVVGDRYIFEYVIDVDASEDGAVPTELRPRNTI